MQPLDTELVDPHVPHLTAHGLEEVQLVQHDAMIKKLINLLCSPGSFCKEFTNNRMMRNGRLGAMVVGTEPDEMRANLQHVPTTQANNPERQHFPRAQLQLRHLHDQPLRLVVVRNDLKALVLAYSM